MLGSICIGNGVWMLADAFSWFTVMPIAAQDTGPLNTHFVHDLGWVFILAGLGALWCSYKIKECKVVHIGVMLFIAGHALIHIIEIMLGMLPPTHWLIDFPLVTFPALLLIAMTPFILKINRTSI